MVTLDQLKDVQAAMDNLDPSIRLCLSTDKDQVLLLSIDTRYGSAVQFWNPGRLFGTEVDYKGISSSVAHRVYRLTERLRNSHKVIEL